MTTAARNKLVPNLCLDPPVPLGQKRTKIHRLNKYKREGKHEINTYSTSMAVWVNDDKKVYKTIWRLKVEAMAHRRAIRRN